MNNDLISREALKKAIMKLPNDNPSYWNMCDVVDRERIIDEIDNAPTVPLPDFKEGYKQAIIDGKTNFSRPQGEWVKDGIGGIGSYRCSLCGRVICTSITNNKPYKDYPFCHCGADMRKEDK